MKRTFWLPYAGLLRLRWIVAALLLQLLALGAILRWVHDGGNAGALALAATGITGFWVWMAPAGSLLLHLQHGRELRLPRQVGDHAVRTALLLALNLVPASALIAWRSADADRALLLSLLLLLVLLGQLLFLVTPFRLLIGGVVLLPLLLAAGYVLAPLLPWSLRPTAWSSDWLTPAAVFAVGGAGALLVALARRFVRRPGPGLDAAACVLDLSAGGPPASAYEQPERGLRNLPELLLPRQRVASGDSMQRRVAQLLGSPYAPGSTRRLLAILGAMGLAVVLIGAATSPGVPLFLFVAQTWIAVCITFTVTTRLATLFRSRAPELSELALLPGQGDAQQRGRLLMGLLLWRPLSAQLALTLALVAALWALGQAGGWPRIVALLGLSLLAAALMTLETARYIDRGEGWFGKPWAGSVVYAAMLLTLLAVALWAAIDPFARPLAAGRVQATLGLAVIMLAACSAWRACAAQWRALDRLRALAVPADRVAAAQRG